MPEEDPFLYRHYVTLHPTSNRILSKKWDDANRARHLERLANIKPGINNSPPQVYMHLQLRLKKMQLEQDRLNQIERANRMLLEKMAHIAKSGISHGTVRKAKPVKRNDNIREENIKILNRIQSIKPVYDHQEWDRDHVKHLATLANFAAFPMRYIKELDRMREKTSE